MQPLNVAYTESVYYRDKNLVQVLPDELESIWRQFYDAQQQTLDYRALAGERAYENLRMLARALNMARPQTLVNPVEQYCFWINVYNLMVIHGILEQGNPDSVRSIRGFYENTRYGVGEQIFSLDDIEHGILRGNASKYFGLIAPFARWDTRLPLVIKQPEPRLHFVLYSACPSSPKWQILRPATFEQQLLDATQEQLKLHVRIDGNKLYLPRQFNWYQNDFGGVAGSIQFVSSYHPDSAIRTQLRQAQYTWELNYHEFDWSLNQR